MSTEVRPLGVTCNIQCQYCYQNPQRDAGNLIRKYDLDRMKSMVEEVGGPFTLFGGEPLMMPVEDIEALWSWGYKRFGSNCIQTNAVLINDDHVRMFREYKVHVGISVDGPGALNDARWTTNLDRTRRATDKTHEAIERLCREGIPPSLIVTLHRNNATEDKLPLMHEWMRHLDQIGVTSVRLHTLEVETDAVEAKYALSAPETIRALLSFADLEQELSALVFDLFYDIRRLLLGEDQGTTCIWNACDPYTTRAVQGIEGNGQRSNCGRTNKHGIDFTKADREGFERYLALYQTPQTHGGCKDCRFFLMCKGECPGTALDGDWRNRSADCPTWMALFEHFEASLLDEGRRPLSLAPNRAELEAALIGAWSKGHNNSSIAGALTLQNGSPHGDVAHGDRPHGDSGHGDVPHRDA